MRPHRLWPGALVLAGVLTACGSGGASVPIRPATQAQLRHDLQILAAAASAHHVRAAGSALAMLTTDLRSAHRDGAITDAKLAQIQAAAKQITRDLQAMTVATTTPPPTSTLPTSRRPAPRPAPSPGPGHADRGHGHGHGGD